MTVVPSFLLRRLYMKGSLSNTPDGVAFSLKNVLGQGVITQLKYVKIDEQEFSVDQVQLSRGDEVIKARDVSDEKPLLTIPGDIIVFTVGSEKLEPRPYKIELCVVTREAGQVNLSIEDRLA